MTKNRAFTAFAAITLAAATAVGVSAGSSASEAKPLIPACEYEDGSTQQICVWDGRTQGNGRGDVIVNVDWGNWSYNTGENAMTDYTQEG